MIERRSPYSDSGLQFAEADAATNGRGIFFQAQLRLCSIKPSVPRPVSVSGQGPPFGQCTGDRILHFVSRLSPVITPGEEPVVCCLAMPDVGDDGQGNRLFIEGFRRRGPAHSSAVFLARVLRYLPLPGGWTPRKELFDASGELHDILMVQLLTADSSPLSSPFPDFNVAEALFFRLLQSRCLDQ